MTLYLDRNNKIGNLSDVNATPIIADEVTIFGACNSSTGSIEVSLSKSAYSKLNRMINRVAFGTNNWRKLHGLPKYRKKARCR